MMLEHWDSKKQKYVLYQNAGQHSDDCARFPFASIPQRIFLDTNLINVLVKHSRHVFEREPIPQDIAPKLAIDIEALMHVFYVGTQADWGLFGSQTVIGELSRTREVGLRDDLVEYGLGFVNRDRSDEIVDSHWISVVGWSIRRSSLLCRM